MNKTVSIVIPTLNEAGSIAATLAAVARLRGQVEVIVADAGSPDATVAIARAHGALVITAPRGRGAQMRAGADLATGGAIWFLHADTHPPPDGAERILDALSDPSVAGGNFALRFDGPGRAARFLTWFYPQMRRIGLLYGDSAIFVRSSSYQQVGGFKPFPLFEDLDLVRRLRGVGKLAHIPVQVVASSRRFENGSFVRTFLRATVLQILFWFGVPPRILYRFYPVIR
jgi:rSAM/selenodomain-associated transferase 2